MPVARRPVYYGETVSYEGIARSKLDEERHFDSMFARSTAHLRVVRTVAAEDGIVFSRGSLELDHSDNWQARAERQAQAYTATRSGRITVSYVTESGQVLGSAEAQRAEAA